jgi:pimeloyl-ACP methyl ester carboxylesterase
VLLHGYTDSWRSFERVLPYLPRTFRVFAVSQRGHGDSERPADGYRAEDFARDVAGFLDAVGVKSAVVVGHSMGARNAMRFAIDYPRRTRALVLVGAFVPARPNDGVRGLWEAVSKLTDPVDPAFAREFQQSTLAQPVPPEFLETVVAETLKVPARVWKTALAGFMAADFAGDMSRIAARTLVVWGAKDSFTPRADQDSIVSAIKGAKLLVYPAAGHGVHWEEPERFAKDLSAFIRP